jgi:antitoxin StbD
MQQLLARNSVSITELRKNPGSIIEEANGEPIAILNHNKPEAYLVPASTFEKMMDWIEDVELAEIVIARAGQEVVEVSFDDL